LSGWGQPSNLFRFFLVDSEGAIDFAKEQSDDDLSDELLKYSETRPGKSHHTLIAMF
jgi:hypothetical protein